jgi:hypothetical protein
VTGLPAVCDKALPLARTRSTSRSDADLVFMTGCFNGLFFKSKAEDREKINLKLLTRHYYTLLVPINKKKR